MISCRSCATAKALSEYRFGRKDCRDCERSAARVYGKENRARRNERLSRWRRENPRAARANDERKRLRKSYGITPSEVAAMALAQSGKCALCEQEKRLVVDHCHSTGRVRGLLCHRCNTSLGWLEAHPSVFQRLAKYLHQPCHADVLLELANPPARPLCGSLGDEM